MEQGILSSGKNARKIAEYLQNQLKEDALSDRLTQDLSASFTGGKQRNASAGALYAVSVTGSQKDSSVL